MNTTYILFLGVIIAILSVLPPGLLNMSAAKISLNEGRSRGVIFSIGACVVVMIQTYIASIFSRYLSKNPNIIDILRIIAFALFVFITIYFLFIAKKKEKKTKESKLKSKHNSFFHGMLLSALNVFPIPYQAYMTITLVSYGWMDFSQKSVIFYTYGVAIGSFIALYGYIIFFNKIKNKTLTSSRNINLIIGSITGVISVITLINIINNI